MTALAQVGTSYSWRSLGGVLRCCLAPGASSSVAGRGCLRGLPLFLGGGSPAAAGGGGATAAAATAAAHSKLLPSSCLGCSCGVPPSPSWAASAVGCDWGRGCFLGRPGLFFTTTGWSGGGACMARRSACPWLPQIQLCECSGMQARRSGGLEGWRPDDGQAVPGSLAAASLL